MLQQQNGAIYETGQTISGITSGDISELTGCVQATSCWPYDPTVYWNSYPVYVCSDKTKKAIEILKALQADKQIECKSVPKFIELVEKISALL